MEAAGALSVLAALPLCRQLFSTALSHGPFPFSSASPESVGLNPPCTGPVARGVWRRWVVLIAVVLLFVVGTVLVKRKQAGGMAAAGWKSASAADGELLVRARAVQNPAFTQG